MSGPHRHQPRPDATAATVRMEAGVLPVGSIAATVRLVDTALRDAGRLAVRAGTSVPVRLPAPGRYLLTGETPDGDLIEGALDTVSGPSQARLAPVRTAPGEESGPLPGPPDTALHWSAAGPPEPHPSSVPRPPALPHGSAPPRGTAAPDGTAAWSCVLESPGPGGLLVFTVVPAGGEVVPVPLTSPPAPDRRRERPVALGWAAAPPPGTALTLLGYLHRSALAEAAVVADSVIAEHGPSPAALPDPLTALAVGQALLRAGDARCRPWIAELVGTSPFRTDARVLAWELARRRNADDAVRAADAVRSHLVQSPPLLATSRQRAVRCLDWASEVTGDPRHALARDIALGWEHAAVPAVFTSYTGHAPHLPAAASTPVSDLAVVAPLRAVAAGTAVRRLPQGPDAEAGSGHNAAAAQSPWSFPARPDRSPRHRFPRRRPRTDLRIRVPELVADLADREADQQGEAVSFTRTGDGGVEASLTLLPGQEALLRVRAPLIVLTGEAAARVDPSQQTPGPGADTPLVTVRVEGAPAGERALTLLVPLTAPTGTGDGRLWGEVGFAWTEAVGDVVVEAEVRRASDLTEEDVPLVVRSFAAADTRRRNTWRAIARALPDGHPIRSGVVSAVRRRPRGTDGTGRTSS
ncbi:hypothetical protein [Streptomyces sp. NPDC014746]|uniref:hypothetical protein n=1 Tax=Streptomyces sp. NPDC014746 TaxID=3364904 RepID=UPI0036F890AB